MNNNIFMNDTLDNFNFSQNIANDLYNIFSKNSLLTEKNVSDSGVSSGPDTEVSLDDSLFLSNSIVVPCGAKQTTQDFKSLRNSIMAVTPENQITSHYENKQVTKSTAINDSQPAEQKRSSGKFEGHIESNKDRIESSLLLKELNISHNTINKTLEHYKNEGEIHSWEKLETQIKHANYSTEMYSLASWGLPEAILENYALKKLHNMFQWQVECLNNDNILSNNKNLVYSAPTSAGKTLVAEILAIKTVFERRKKVIFILPFVSIVREKMYYFQDLLGSSGVRVDGFMGSYNPPGGFTSVQIAICTIEKANSLINRLLEEGSLSDIGAILVDEIHLLGDPSRGYLLELLLTKLMYISKKEESIQIQIVGMSAVLPNLDILAEWLEAELYKTNFRPVPLYEQAVVSGEVYDSNFKLSRKLLPLPEIGCDTDNILQLCLETIRDSCSILIFCPTKNWCENLAQQIASAFSKLGKYCGFVSRFK